MVKNRLGKWCVSLSILGFAISSCKNNNQTNTNNTDSTVANTSMDVPSVAGVYEAELPCADCPGINTHLILQKDFTYIKEENYKGVADTIPHLFYDIGKWTIKDSIIILTGQTSDTIRLKQSSNSALQMLPESGTSIPDSVATMFQFKPKGKNYQTIQPFLVSGVLDKTDGKNNLFVCVWGKTETVSFTNIAQKQLDTLWSKLEKPTATKAIVQVEAQLDPKQSDQLNIQKVNTVINGENCN